MRLPFSIYKIIFQLENYNLLFSCSPLGCIELADQDAPLNRILENRREIHYLICLLDVLTVFCRCWRQIIDVIDFYCGIQYTIQKLLFILNVNNLCISDKFGFGCFLIPITTLSEQCTVNEYRSW